MVQICTDAELANYQANGWKKACSIRKKQNGKEYREIILKRDEKPASCKDGYCFAAGKVATYMLTAPIIFVGTLLSCVCDCPNLCDSSQDWTTTLPCGPNFDHYRAFTPFCPPPPEKTEMVVRVLMNENTALVE